MRALLARGHHYGYFFGYHCTKTLKQIHFKENITTFATHNLLKEIIFSRILQENKTLTS